MIYPGLIEETKMNSKTGGNRGPRRAGALAVGAAAAMLTACSAVHISGGSGFSEGSATRGPAPYAQELAYARCMQTHGLPNFPDPSPSEHLNVHVNVNGNASSPAARAFDACKHLLPDGTATASATVSPSGAAATDCLALPSPCYTPRQLRVAYGIQPLLDRGITGRGQTVVLLEFPPATAGSATDIRQDLARFDGMFGLPAAQLQVVNTLAHEASPWLAPGEEVEDTEIVHAVAPDAAIREVLMPSLDTASTGAVSAAFLAALRLGLTQGAVISLSDDAGEQCFSPAAVAQGSLILQAAQRDHVTVVFSSGDAGAAADTCPGAGTGSAMVKGVNWPASDPLALAVGGTSLQASRATGAYISETAWNIPAAAGGSAPKASGGGFSRLFPRPAYQDGIADIGATRGVPDVAADADPGTGMALAFSGGSEGNILTGAGGTSAAAPLWAAVIALADQYAGRPLGFVNPALYQIGHSASYHQAFHDVTTGTNTVQFPAKTITGYQAAPGWDPVTGWGSPNAQVLVPLLARNAVP
jgi:subtilase family serine protease